MDFMTAMQKIMGSFEVYRKSWSGYYVACLRGQSYLWKIGDTNQIANINASIYVPSVDDIFANDWMVKN